MPMLINILQGYMNGADLHMGTPGRQSTVNKRENGTTAIVGYNNAEYVNICQGEMREKDPEASTKNSKKVEKFKKERQI